MDEVLHKLIEFVESASPIVWAAAQQQVQANIIETAIWLGITSVLFLVLLVISIYCARMMIKQSDSYDRNGWQIEMGFSIAGTVLLFLIVGGLLGDLLKMLNNPLWYAIKILGELVP